MKLLGAILLSLSACALHADIVWPTESKDFAEGKAADREDIVYLAKIPIITD